MLDGPDMSGLCFKAPTSVYKPPAGYCAAPIVSL
jgi:hypothetical protein